MTTNNSQALDPQTVKSLVAEWQMCRHENLPGLFLACHATDGTTDEYQTERIVTFVLNNAQMEEIIKLGEAMFLESENECDETKKPRFLTHVGLKDGYLNADKIGLPYFTLFLQIRNDDSGRYDNCFELKWQPNPSFPTNSYESPLSGKDAIPGASAFLFVHKWLETPVRDLAKVFEATAYNLGRRIKGFRYPDEDTSYILEAMKEENSSNTGVICLHLGSGITVDSHPYAFRPILEITQVKPGVNSAADGGGGGKFFDFASPVPPY